MSLTQPRPDGVLLTVRLTPKGGRTVVGGVVRDAEGRAALMARVSAPPVDGAANAALGVALARAFGVAPRDVKLVSGATARLKRFVIEGDTAMLTQRALELAAAG